MLRGMKHIWIVPLFNQTPFFWSEFVSIQNKSMQGSYGYVATPEEAAFEISKLNSSWRRFSSHFAFGAYDGNRMVGFINGVISRNVATVKGLYVLPAYQKRGAGARLLSAAERAASIHVNSMELFAVDGAAGFYEARKYTVAPSTGQHAKSMRGAMEDIVVPVFYCRPDMARHYQGLAAGYDLEFDADDVNVRHMPMFVYVDGFGCHTGYILGRAVNGDIRVRQLCVHPGAASADVVRRLMESMAGMNIR